MSNFYHLLITCIMCHLVCERKIKKVILKHTNKSKFIKWMIKPFHKNRSTFSEHNRQDSAPDFLWPIEVVSTAHTILSSSTLLGLQSSKHYHLDLKASINNLGLFESRFVSIVDRFVSTVDRFVSTVGRVEHRLSQIWSRMAKERLKCRLSIRWWFERSVVKKSH